ncbi:MAG: DNA polymerase III subunit delta [Sphingomonas sp.]|nr:DNA polymerase III subunit delta [Sphingomonas sp.]
MKAAKGSIAKLLDQPAEDIRFYLFWGPDEGQSRAQASRLLQALGADRFIVISSAVKTDPAALADEAGAMALFGGRRLIWIEPAGDEIKDGIAALLAGPATESPVVAIASASSRPKELIKLAEGSPLAVSFASYAPEGVEAERMVIDIGRRVGLNIERPVASRIAAACGNDQAVVAQELEKMSLYLDASTSRPKSLDHEAVDAVGAHLGDSDVLHLADLAMSGEVEAVAEALGGIGASAQAIPILRALQRRLLMIAPARAKVEQGERPDAVMASLGKALFWKDKGPFGAMLQRWSAADIAHLAERSGKAERALLFDDAPEQAALGEELLAVARAARRR